MDFTKFIQESVIVLIKIVWHLPISMVVNWFIVLALSYFTCIFWMVVIGFIVLAMNYFTSRTSQLVS